MRPELVRRKLSCEMPFLVSLSAEDSSVKSCLMFWPESYCFFFFFLFDLLLFAPLNLQNHSELCDSWKQMLSPSPSQFGWWRELGIPSVGVHREWISGIRVLGFCVSFWLWIYYNKLMSSRWCSGKESACQGRRHKRLGFDSWVGKIPWSRKWQPTPVFLPGKIPWTEEPGGLPDWGHNKSDTNKHKGEREAK